MEELYGLLIIPGPAILCWQAYQWTKVGYWTPLPVSQIATYVGWPLQHVEWIGLQKIVDYLLDIPTSFAVFVLGIFLMIGLMFLQTEYERRYPGH